MQSVTSNAVASAFGVWETLYTNNQSQILFCETKFGKLCRIHFQDLLVTTGNTTLLSAGSIPAKYRPYYAARAMFIVKDYNTYGFVAILANGSAVFASPIDGAVFGDALFFVD